MHPLGKRLRKRGLSESEMTSASSDSFDSGVSFKSDMSMEGGLYFRGRKERFQSSKEPCDMMRDIRKVLDAVSCSYTQEEKFLLICHHGNPRNPDFVTWEMEVCRVPHLSCYGVRFKRLYGSSKDFKDIASKVANMLKF